MDHEVDVGLISHLLSNMYLYYRCIFCWETKIKSFITDRIGFHKSINTRLKITANILMNNPQYDQYPKQGYRVLAPSNPYILYLILHAYIYMLSENKKLWTGFRNLIMFIISNTGLYLAVRASYRCDTESLECYHMKDPPHRTHVEWLWSRDGNGSAAPRLCRLGFF